MMCQHCNQNEAENHFIIHTMSGQREVHLCDKCTRMFHQYTQSIKQQKAWPGESLFDKLDTPAAPKRQLGEIPFPFDAGAQVRRRRQINQLRGQMQDAIDNERYEEAARLRDKISKAEKDVYAHES